LEEKNFKIWLSELKSKCDIVSVVSKYCNLTRRGSHYWTCCPFHNEKTPSMCIYEYEQTFHCFGCKEFGDVIKFVLKIESCDFMQAVEILCHSIGEQVPNFSSVSDDSIKEKKKEKDNILKLLNDAMEHYKENLYLDKAKPAQNYIKSRQLTKRELDDFSIGYSLDYKEMISYLKSKGYSQELMKKAGVAEVSDKGYYYDTYGGRLMFPLFNVYNECVGFSARILTNDKNKAKYKNSPNNVVFDKSKTMFGLNLVRKLKQKQAVDRVIIVEGQMDVIAMHKAGFKNTVASLGTAFNEQHAKMLKLISNNVILCLDGDFAGQKASYKIIDVLSSNGFNVRVVKLPDNNDPDEYIKKYGIESMQKQLDNAKDAIEFKIEYVAQNINFDMQDEKAKFIRDALAILNTLGSDSEKQIYLKKIKEISGVPIDVLRQDLFKNNVFTDETKNLPTKEMAGLEDGTNKAIKFILASMLYKKDYVNYKVNLNKYLYNNTYVKLYELLMNKVKNKENFTVSSLIDEFNFEQEPNLIDIVNYNFEQNGNNEKYYNECLWNIVEKHLKQQQADLNEKFQNSKDSNERKQILLEISNITKKLKNRVMED